MPLQNRVLPTGEIVAIPERGTLTGNRGILHDEGKRLGTSRWRHPNWVCCRLDFRGRRRQVMTPGTWTELFFLDEAVALAAGHRPCAFCRRPDYLRFLEAWERATSRRPKAHQIDRILHTARVGRNRSQIRYRADLEGLPDGCFVHLDGAAHLVLGPALLPFSPGGYLAPMLRRTGPVTVLTSAPLVVVLRAGYRPALHPTARADAFRDQAGDG